jgi:hypothetical protein
MRHSVEIENIDEMRRREGIDDVELWEQIRALQVGDFVRLTFLTGSKPIARETLLVRITSIRCEVFRAKLTERPASTGLSTLRVGSLIPFTTDQIHSIPKEQRNLASRRSCP